jgi:PPOX class probable F420-dependent enzyme
MPSAPVPAEVDEFLRRPNPAVVASVRGDGSPHTVATWYDWDDNRALLNMDETRLRLRFMRRDPRVALTVLDAEGWYRHVSLLGHIVSLEDDRDLRDIDRLALRYTGKPFSRRDAHRVSAWVEVEAWHGWSGSSPWPDGS